MFSAYNLEMILHQKVESSFLHTDQFVLVGVQQNLWGVKSNNFLHIILYLLIRILVSVIKAQKVPKTIYYKTIGD